MSAVDSFFVDTNVLLYRFGAFHEEKRRSADAWFGVLWSTDTGRISWQVIFEFYSNVLKKMETPQATARAAVETLLLWNPEKFDVSGNGFVSSHATETFQLHEVHASTAELAAINSHRVDVFDDLGTGTFYGERVMSAARDIGRGTQRSSHL